MIQDFQDNYCPFPEKRVKERSVYDAMYRVNEWRRLYEQGITKENKKKQRITLQEAANLVKIPKKTLEDYVQIFKKVRLISQIEEFANKKMGFLRAFIRKNKSKIKKAALIYKLQQRGQIEEQQEIRNDFENVNTIGEDQNNQEFYEQESYSHNIFYSQIKF
ncbi:unnamed protein product [Paramecium sonneborni]|uniref:Uncharacterized protein n=1 Tax=Paramecium sonneborni TaxID=65129 RepID=A0A8S1MM91_9CILI|nr:unnamed protein product [Paramecium sonneborni]